MNPRHRGVATYLLLAHAVIGVVAAGIGAMGRSSAFATAEWGIYTTVGYMSLVSSQSLLLGIWSGLSDRPFTLRITGLVIGSACITFLAGVGSGLYSRFNDALFLSGLFTTALAVGGLFLFIRRLFRVFIATHDSSESDPPTASRFSITQAFAITTGVGVLLGCGRVVRSLGGESLGVVVFLPIFAVCGCMVAWLVAWAVLGRGRLLPRVSLAFLAGGLVGLMPPAFLGGPYWRFLVWSGWMLATEAIAMTSLMVVRSCGCRLAIDRAQTPKPGAADGPFGD